MDEMAVTVERTDAREWSDEQMADLYSDGFPEFIVADKLAAQYIDRVRAWFPHLRGAEHLAPPPLSQGQAVLP